MLSEDLRKVITDVRRLSPTVVLKALWFRWRCMMYLANPRIGPFTRYFVKVMRLAFYKAGTEINLVLRNSNPDEIIFAVINMQANGETPTGFIDNILRNIFGMETPGDYQFKFLADGTMDDTIPIKIYQLSFKPSAFVSRLEDPYYSRQATGWETIRDAWEVAWARFCNLFVLLTLWPLTVMVALLWLLLILNPK